MPPSFLLLLRGSYYLAAGSEKLTSEAIGKGLCVFRLSTAEHHEVAVIAARHPWPGPS